MTTSVDIADYLRRARQRGDNLLHGVATPQGLAHITTYVGLLDTALELAVIIKTEQRDLAAIRTYYDIERLKLEQSFKEIEFAANVDFENDTALRQDAMMLIDGLMKAGKYELAVLVYELMLSQKTGSLVDKILAYQAPGAPFKTITLRPIRG